MEKEKEFILGQPSWEQREEWHADSSIGELSTVEDFADILNDDSIEIELVESVAEIMERLDRGKVDLKFIKKSQLERWT